MDTRPVTSASGKPWAEVAPLDTREGDILLVARTKGGLLGKLINFGQTLGGDPARYHHVAVFIDQHGFLVESLAKIKITHFAGYLKGHYLLAILRHDMMDRERFNRGIVEAYDNVGMVYPAHRIAVHAVEMPLDWCLRKLRLGGLPSWCRLSRHLPLDWPVCSELVAQFLIAAGLSREDLGFPHKGWRGITPDDFDDARQREGTKWKTVAEFET